MLNVNSEDPRAGYNSGPSLEQEVPGELLLQLKSEASNARQSNGIFLLLPN